MPSVHDRAESFRLSLDTITPPRGTSGELWSATDEPVVCYGPFVVNAKSEIV